jgi:hypothetical protein
VEVENNRIIRVKGDKANARSEGYVCRKVKGIIDQYGPRSCAYMGGGGPVMAGEGIYCVVEKKDKEK